MQRIENVAAWYHLPSGSALPFPGKKRRVRLEVNSPDEVRLYLLVGEAGEMPEDESEAEMLFLALVRGRDTIEFYAEGPFKLMADGADCYVLTADGQTTHAVVEAPQSFTRIMERRPRNLELERIAAEMQFNMNRRMDAQARDIAQRYEARLEALQQKPTYAPPPGGAGSQPASDGDGKPSDSPPAGADPGAKPGK